jgi:Ca2+-binding RTX toxin-like protein
LWIAAPRANKRGTTSSRLSLDGIAHSVAKTTCSDDACPRRRLVKYEGYTSERGHGNTSHALPRKARDMRKIALLMASMAFTLLLASGVALALNTIRCDGGKCNGTPRNDRMLGTTKRDIMYGFKGDDRLLGEGSKDDLYGLDGRDVVLGDAGADKLGGGEDNDELHGLGGADSASGGAGNDDLDGGDGSDKLSGGDGRDNFWNVDHGNDTINGGLGSDTFGLSDVGDDKVFGGPGEYRDFFGYDTQWRASGQDLLDGGNGNDSYFFDDSFRFGRPARWGHVTIADSDVAPAPDENVPIEDELQFYIWRRDLTITLVPGPGPEATDGISTAQWSDTGEFREVLGGDGDDTITGDKWPNVIYGEWGANTLSGGGGNDVLDSDDDGGTLDGGGGNDNIAGHRGATLLGGGGNDHMTVEGEDPEQPPAPPSNLHGGPGHDDIRARNGSPDTIDCGDGTDTVTYDAADTVTHCEDTSTG